MSKFIEIEIKLIPIYGSAGLAGRFPNLANFLKEWGYERVLEEQPNVYQLVDVLTRLRNDPAIPDTAKKPIHRFHDKIQKVRDEAREHLLSRHLNELDQTLYRLEDLYEDLEKEMGW